MEPTAEDIAAHKAFMDSLGQEASDKGYMPPMDMVKAYTDAEHPSGAAATAATAAQDLREQGNKAMQAGEFSRALKCYTEALEVIHDSGEPSTILHILFGNRSAAFLKLDNAKCALEDAQSAVTVNPNYVKGHFRLASALAHLGEKPEMREAARKGLSLDPTNRELREMYNSK